MKSQDSISIHRCGLKSAPVKGFVHKGKINSTFMKVMGLFFVVLTASCTQPLNEKNIIGSWIITDMKTPALNEEEELAVWLNNSNDNIAWLFSISDIWKFKEKNVLEYPRGIWYGPKPKNYKLDNHKLSFYIDNFKNNSQTNSFAEFTIIEISKDQFSIKQIDASDEVAVVIVFKRMKP